jgi:hypothetical protein
VPTGQFWSFVAANRLRLATLRDGLVQDATHAPAGEVCIHSQGETLSRECVNHAQHPNRPAGSNFIVRKIQSPFLIGGCVLA